ncbi:MAG TPA: PPC domain-containing protein [Longimicrobium sp.]
MRPGTFARKLPLLITTFVLAACAETSNPVAPETVAPDAPNALLSLTCTASTTTRTVSCGAPKTGDINAAIIGGQNQYVKLTSSNIQVVADTFAFDVTVENLIPQPLGTTNGTTADAAGVRVFFQSGPTSTGGGTMTVANADGTASFTAASQPYFQYNGILAQNSISPVKRWKLQFSPEVTNFTFQLYVSAAVQFPDGYVDDNPYVVTLNPSESVGLPATVRDLVGNDLPGEPVSWTSDAPATASVSGSQVTAGGSRGFANLTASSGPRPNVYSTAVSVCQATVVSNGTSLPSSIASTDCFSSYGDPNGRPTTSFYGDLYRVALTAGQTVTVTMDSGDDLDTYLLLASPTSGFLVAGNDDDDTEVLGVGSRIIYTATATGVYVIEASTFQTSDTGNYTLNVTIS